MDQSKIRPLKPLRLGSRPLISQALAWSCDGELAVAADDTIYVFMPTYPNADMENEPDDLDVSLAQFSTGLETIGVIQPSQSINARLCAFSGIKLPPTTSGEENYFQGIGFGTLTGAGASMHQILRMEWSPNGLGCNSRPILLGMLTNGAVLAFGEDIDPHSNMTTGETARGFKFWRILWGLGANLPIPDGESESGFSRMYERIKSFSWAPGISANKALLAYANDVNQVVIRSIQYIRNHHGHETNRAAEGRSGWKVEELVRFDGSGPHTSVDKGDPDFVPGGTPYSLSWSPWLVSENSRTATLAYVARNFVGFRRVTIAGEWASDKPQMEVEASDSTSICVNLSADAFVKWEDAIWYAGDSATSRGAIVTPFVVKPFQVNLAGPTNQPLHKHSTKECDTVYSKEDVPKNPITGLIIHKTGPNEKSLVPQYSLVRLSATPTNQDWFETNRADLDTPNPQWADRINKQMRRTISRLQAMSEPMYDSDSDDSDFDMADDNGTTRQVHPCRYRIWDFAVSPGQGSSAVLISKHSTIHPQRRGISTVLFSWQPRSEETQDLQKQKEPDHRLTTEGQMWEWMYGLGAEVPGATKGAEFSTENKVDSLRELFKDVAAKQNCVFCESEFQIGHDVATCRNGHAFATCATSGLAILSPGISRICAVCGLRCLKAAELARLAREHLRPDMVMDLSGELCGGCGGKFVT